MKISYSDGALGVGVQIERLSTNLIVWKSIFSILILGFIFPKPVYSQEWKNVRFERISIEEGLSQSMVTCILQDRQGFMWFGTQDGLNKYDGYRFTIYRHDPINKASISNNYIWSIFEDTEGNLWIGTNGGGLDIFDQKTQTFTHYQHQADNPQSLSNNIVRLIYEDSQGDLWIGTYGGGLDKFDRKTQTFTHYKNQPDNPQSLSNNIVRSVYEDSQGDLWIGTYGGGLDKFDRKTQTFTHYRNQADNPQSLSDNYILWIYEDDGGILWIGTFNGGLNKFDRKTQTFTRYQNQADNLQSLSHNTVRSIFEDSRGNLWIGTYGGGLNRLDRETETFTRYQKLMDNPMSLSNNFVLSILEDAGGNLWVGTFGSGLNKLDLRAQAFIRYQNEADNPQSLSNNSVWSIHEDSRDTLWIGTNNGLNNFDRKTQTFTRYYDQADNPQSLSNNFVLSISGNSRDSLWIGTYGGGLNRFDQETKTFIRYQNQADNPHSLSNNVILSVLEDSGGNIWVGTFGGGLNKLNRKTQTFTRYQNQADNSQSLGNNTVFSIYEDKAGNLWIGTSGGMNEFDRETETFTRYQHQADNPNSLSHNTVYSFYEDTGGNLWIGTSGGLNKFDRKKQNFTIYRKKDGLPNDTIFGILEDNKGNLWLSTNKGISKYNQKKNIFTNYSMKDGLQSDEYNTRAYHKDRAGRMYFGGVNGFNEFDPDSIQDNTEIPPIVITDFLLFNKSVSIARSSVKSDNFQLQRHINFTKEITLDYTDYIFAFEFSALNYRQPEKNQFAYKLEGFNEDWVETDYLHRRATYTDLSHGNYILRVKASNDDGYWNQKGTSIKLTILPPPWLTWWAYTLYTLAFIGLLYWFVQSQRKKVIQKQIELNREKVFSTRLEKKVIERTAEVVKQRDEIQRQAEQLEKLSIVASETDNAVLIMDEKGNFEWINKGYHRLYGLTLEKLIQKRGYNLVAASQYKEIAEVVNECVREKKSVQYEFSSKNASAEQIWVQTTLTPILDDQDRIFKLVAIDTDISELKRAQKQALQHAHKAGMADIAINTIHNVGNMLNSAKVALELVCEYNKNSAVTNYQKANVLLRQNMHRLEDFICHDAKGKQLMEYYLELEKNLQEENKRIMDYLGSIGKQHDLISNVIAAQGRYANEAKAMESEINLEDLIQDALTIEAEYINSNDIQVKTSYESVLAVKTQHNKLIQVLVNLIRNAVEAMGKNTSERVLKISLTEVDQEVCIKIEDNGHGIAESNLDRVFSQGFSTRSNNRGYGLHDCANFITEMGGKLTGRSAGPDQGACFEVRLPYSETTVSQIAS